MALPNILRNCAVHVDGIAKIGEVEEMRIPVPELQTEEYRGGGMDAGVDLDLGMKKLDCSFKMFSFDDFVQTRFGILPGNAVAFDFYGHLVSENGNSRRVWARMDVMLTKVDPGTWAPGKKSSLDIAGNCRFYKLLHGPTEIYYIDVINGIRRVNGVDLTAQMRANLAFF